MCIFGGVFGNFAAELGPKSLAVSEKASRRCQQQSAMWSQEIPQNLMWSLAGQRDEVPSLSHRIPSPRGLAGSNKLQLVEKHQSRPSCRRAISSLPSCKN